MLDMVAKLLLHKQLKFELGKITLLEQRVAMLPLFNVVELQKELERKGLENTLYYTNKKFGREWTSKIYKSFKMNENQIFEWGINSVSLAGWGKVELAEKNLEKNNIKFRLIDSGMSYYYGKTEKPVDHIFRGMIAGAMSAVYGKDLDAVETKCKAQGNPICEFVVQPKEMFENSDIAKKQLKEQKT
ncbi:MAG: V4R domain-containing protein [Candidatus Omnitrophota bacterium]